MQDLGDGAGGREKFSESGGGGAGETSTRGETGNQSLVDDVSGFYMATPIRPFLLTPLHTLRTVARRRGWGGVGVQW